MKLYHKIYPANTGTYGFHVVSKLVPCIPSNGIQYVNGLPRFTCSNIDIRINRRVGLTNSIEPVNNIGLMQFRHNQTGKHYTKRVHSTGK